MSLTHGHSHRRSCWGVARTAFVLFLAGVAVAYLFGGFDPGTVRPS